MISKFLRRGIDFFNNVDINLNGPSVGSTIVYIECNGCMADVKDVKMIGIVKRIINQQDLYGPNSESLIIVVCEDILNTDRKVKQTFNVVLKDPCLQKQNGVSNLYFLLK